MSTSDVVTTHVLPVLERVLGGLAAKNVFEGPVPAIALEPTRRAEHGDLASNVALVLAKRTKLKPRDLAEKIKAGLLADADAASLFKDIQIAGPGFINLTLARRLWRTVLGDVLGQGDHYGFLAPTDKSERVLVEFVSANPTGPLHVGHGRCAAIGDAIARLLAATGVRVEREFYINDAGNQILMLGLSVFARYLEARGRQGNLPENGYRGEYIIDLGKALADEVGDRYESADGSPEQLAPIRAFAMARMLEWQRKTLERFGVVFNTWFSEQSLYADGRVEACLAELRRAGHLYDEGGAVWFKSKELGGDERDRVVVKSTGEKTYLAGDLAYHKDKLGRGFGRLINVLGADHVGHSPGLRAALTAFGCDPNAVEVLLYQMVHLFRGGQEVKMGKRSGEFVTLDDLVSEVGVDASRFFFLARRHDSHLDFDVELAKKQSLDNPVFYVQYGYARTQAILRRAETLFAADGAEGNERAEEVRAAGAARKREDATRGVPEEMQPRWENALSKKASWSDAYGESLDLPEEIEICKKLAAYPSMVMDAAAAREPHRITNYLVELAQQFQSYYTQLQKVHGDTILPQARHRQQDGWQTTWNWDKTCSRLLWVRATGQVMKNALALLGMKAPERMDRAEGADDQDFADGPGNVAASTP